MGSCMGRCFPKNESSVHYHNRNHIFSDHDNEFHFLVEEEEISNAESTSVTGKNDIPLQCLDVRALLIRNGEPTTSSTPASSLDLEWEHEALPVSMQDPSMSDESIISSPSERSELDETEDTDDSLHFVRQSDPEREICNILLETDRKPIPCGNDFKMHVNVKGLRPSQIKIKIGPDRKSVIVEALQIDNEDPDDVIMRNVARKFTVPESCDLSKMTSKLNKGVLVVRVPKKQAEEVKD